jgi:hypothetical protein
MSYSKIGQIVLYIIVIITIPIMFLFFGGSSLINQEEYDSKVNKIENPAAKTQVAQDLQSADSLATPGTDSAKVVTNVITPGTPSAPSAPVNLTFMERLVYYKTDIPLIWGYVLLVVSIVITIVFPVIYIIKHPVNLLRTFLLLIGVAVLVGLAFLAANGKPIDIPGYTGPANSNYNIMKLIDAGLIFSYFMLGLSLLAILYAEVSKYFR